MSNQQHSQKAGRTKGNGANGLLVADVVRFLSRFASLQRDERVGNPNMSDSLRCLIKGLRPHQGLTVEELSRLLAGMAAEKTAKPQSRKPNADLPQDLALLTCDEVGRILDDENSLKKQLVELGNCRFGIPRSKLKQLPKPKAIVSIRAALDHERSLAALAHQAEMAGRRRAV